MCHVNTLTDAVANLWCLHSIFCATFGCKQGINCIVASEVTPTEQHSHLQYSCYRLSASGRVSNTPECERLSFTHIPLFDEVWFHWMTANSCVQIVEIRHWIKCKGEKKSNFKLQSHFTMFTGKREKTLNTSRWFNTSSLGLHSGPCTATAAHCSPRARACA